MATDTASEKGQAKVVALATGPSALELGLTGVHVEELDDIAEIEKRLIDLLDSDMDVLIVNESFRGRFTEWCQGRLERHGGLPLVIYCPSFSEEDADTEAYIGAIVKSAVGFEIRLD